MSAGDGLTPTAQPATGATREAGADPVVDIGIPTVGRSRLLHEAIESVLAQSFQRWRLVISENGAGSPEVAEGLAPYLEDDRIEHRPTGRRVSAATNHSLLITTGTAPYLALLHDDDLWDPGFLERRVEFLDAHPTCGFVFSGTRQIDETGRSLGRVKFVLREGLYSPAEFAPLLLDPQAAGALLPAPTIELVRRSAYEAVGPAFDETFPLTFDSEMLVRLAVRYPVGYLAGWDASYRLHSSQTSFHKHWGKEMIRRQASAEAQVRHALPEVELDRRGLARHRSEAYLTAALDAAEDEDAAAALAYLKMAVRQSPRALANARTPATLAALVSGRRGRRALAQARTRVLRWHMSRRYARDAASSSGGR